MLLAMLSGIEILVIVAVVLLIFGPSKLPQLGEGVGKMLRGFKKEMRAIDDEKKADEGKTAAKAIEPDAEGEDGEIDVTPKSKDAGKAEA